MRQRMLSFGVMVFGGISGAVLGFLIVAASKAGVFDNQLVFFGVYIAGGSIVAGFAIGYIVISKLPKWQVDLFNYFLLALLALSVVGSLVAIVFGSLFGITYFGGVLLAMFSFHWGKHLRGSGNRV